MVIGYLYPNNMLSLFGNGFIGHRYYELNNLNNDIYIEPRESNNPTHDNILYLISTTHNYHIYSNINIDIDTNLKKLVAVLENCKNRENLIFNFISSWFVYGNIKPPFREDDLCAPKGFYSITKKTAEDLLISFCSTFNIKYRIFRLANVYGNGDKHISKQKNALQYLINEIKLNHDIDLYYGGDFYRDYIYVDDVCAAMKFLMKHAPVNEIYNIGNGRPIKFLELMNYVKNKYNSSSIFNPILPPVFHKNVQVRDAYLDIRKLENLGYFNNIDIWKGLDKII